MKTMSKILLAAGSVVPAVCIRNAVKIKKKNENVSSAVSWTKEEADKYAGRLSEMVKIPTISRATGEEYGDFLKLQEKLAELYPLFFANTEKHDIQGNLLRLWKGKNPEKGCVLFMGHQDVVPVDQADWKKDPYSGAVEDGAVWGRGSMDCKSTLSCELSAAEELMEAGFQPDCDIWFSASVNEEISGGGSELIVEYLQSQGIRPRFVMDEGGAIVEDIFPGLSAPCAAIGIVEKGFVNVKFTARSAGGHASTPNVNGPLVRLGKFMAEVDRKQPFIKELSEPLPQMFDGIAPYMSFPFRLVLANRWLFGNALKLALSKVNGSTRAFVQSTAAFTMCGGSEAPNVIPDGAYVICNMRPAVHQDAQSTIAAVKKIADKYDIETEVLFSRDASHLTPTDGSELRFIEKCVSDCLPGAVVIPYLMAGGTDSRNYEPVCDNILRFTPTRLTSEQLAAMHAANENIGVEALAEGVKIYRYIMENLEKM